MERHIRPDPVIGHVVTVKANGVSCMPVEWLFN